MQFLYCKECNNLRPRGLFIWTRRCELCFGDMLKIDVPMTVIAPFYYLSVAIAMVLVALYFSDLDIPFGVWSIVLSAVIVVILAFFDYTISYERARERIVRIERNKKD